MSELPALPDLSSDQKSQLNRYLDRLLESNKSFNLTAIVDPNQARERHIDESLRLAPLLSSLVQNESNQPRRRVIDIGSGGGLPGMVMAIACPNLDFVLLESIAKKARFLKDTANALGLDHVTVLCDRAELAAAPHAEQRETFDVVTARAVAALPTLLELAVPFVKPGGHLLLVKGQRYQEELDASHNALRILNTELLATERQPSATVLILRKTRPTDPLYPRRSGEPKRKPL